MSILHSKTWPRSLDLLQTVQVEKDVQSICFEKAEFTHFVLDNYTNTLMMELKLTTSEDIKLLASIQKRFERTFHNKYKLFHPLVQTKVVRFFQLDPEGFRVLLPEIHKSINHVKPGFIGTLDVKFAGFTSTSLFNAPVLQCVRFQ